MQSLSAESFLYKEAGLYISAGAERSTVSSSGVKRESTRRVNSESLSEMCLSSSLTRDKFKLPENIRDMITRRQSGRRKWQVYRNQYIWSLLNQRNRKVRSVIYDFRNERWNTFVGSLSKEEKTIWKTPSRMLRKRTHILAIHSPNGMAYTNNEKVGGIAESLRSQFTAHSDHKNSRVIALLGSTMQLFLYWLTLLRRYTRQPLVRFGNTFWS